MERQKFTGAQFARNGLHLLRGVDAGKDTKTSVGDRNYTANALEYRVQTIPQFSS